ncbi:MAG: 6-phosphogluconolactonase [Rhodobacteraceae bacterium]|nr:6-phosphogluconolactonase [Paracoccaceae bacterium]
MAGNRNLKLVSYKNEQEWKRGITSQIISALKEDERISDFQTLVVPGGTTPGPIFDDLSSSELNWSKVIVVPSDERCVPLDTPRSNYFLIKQTLIKNRAVDAQTISLYDENEEFFDLQETNKRINSVLPVSVCVLGMGEDLHTASLFPDSPELATAVAPDAPNAIKVSVPTQPEDRITLTLKVLMEARHIHVIFKGRAKKQKLMENYKVLEPRKAPILNFASKATFHYVE